MRNSMQFAIDLYVAPDVRDTIILVIGYLCDQLRLTDFAAQESMFGHANFEGEVAYLLLRSERFWLEDQERAS
jgi:hypothetical protein